MSYMKTKRKFLTYKSKTGKLHSVEISKEEFAEKSLCGISEERLELYSLVSWDATCIRCNTALLHIDCNLLDDPASEWRIPDDMMEKIKRLARNLNEN